MTSEKEDLAPRKEPFWRFWECMAIVALLLGLIGAGIYASSHGEFGRIFAILALVGFASWLGGSLIGFLFGVPRFEAGRSPNNDGSRFIPNTNLEQISDWLTKIIIGATLVQIKEIAIGVGNLANAIGIQLQTSDGGIAAGAVMLFFFFTGFMWGYLWCSLRIFHEMAELNRQYAPRAPFD